MTTTTSAALLRTAELAADLGAFGRVPGPAHPGGGRGHRRLRPRPHPRRPGRPLAATTSRTRSAATSSAPRPSPP